jgi:glycerol-3-phosphate dehydrogenase
MCAARRRITTRRADLPERLALENALDAERHGGVILNYCAATSTLVENGVVSGVHVRDQLDRAEGLVHARVVVYATGAWAEQGIRKTKGVHAVCPR